MDIREIKPNPKNPRLIKDERFEVLKKSIQDFPEMLTLRPIVIDEDNMILGGNMRYKACKALGMKDIPVKIAKGLTEEQKAEFVIKDNVSGGDWDWKILTDEWDKVKLEEWGLEFPELEITKIEGEEDDFDTTPPVEPKSKLGDLYQLGEHRLLRGDATKIEDVERLMGGEKADMVFTDPPYGVSYVGKTKDALTIENDELEDDGALFSFLSESLGNAVAVLGDGCSIYVAAPARPLNQTFGTVLKELGVWRQTLNWVKNSLVMGRSDYHYRHEPIFYGWKPGASHNWYGDRTQDTIWEIKRPSRSTEHPTMKPIELVVKAINNSSQAGDLVLDTFGGSGSTLIACEQTGRKCRMMELSESYTDVIIQRWMKLTHKPAFKIADAAGSLPNGPVSCVELGFTL